MMHLHTNIKFIIIIIIIIIIINLVLLRMGEIIARNILS